MGNKHIKLFEEYNIKCNFELDDIVKIDPNNDNDSYDEYKNINLRIINVASGKHEHPGFDDSLSGQCLYDLRVEETDEDVPFSLYDYELESVS